MSKERPQPTPYRNYDYKCSVCLKKTPPEELFTKSFKFASLRSKNKRSVKTVSNRVVGWLCETCMKQDPDFSIEKYEKTPGMEPR